MPKITKKIVDAIKPDASKPVVIWDSELRGFGVRVMPSGVGSYILFYRTIEGRQRKMTLGRVGTLTTEQARNLAREKLAEAMTGGDPAAQRQEIRHSMTVAELCDEYLEHAKQRLKPNSYSSNESNIRIHIKPLIGTRAAAKLTVADVVKMQDDITEGKTAKYRSGRGGYSTGGIASASRTMTILGGVLEFGRLRGIVAENVTRGIRKQQSKARDRFLSDEEITRLGAVIRESDHEGLIGLTAVQFLLLTGLRRNEALSLKWDWIDVHGGCIHFPDTKTGKQVRPVGKAAFSVLEYLPNLGQKGFVFPSMRGDGHFIGLPKVLNRLCKAAAVEDVSLHTLRHTFASVAAGMGYSELTIAGLLGHSAQGITARYAHVADKALIGAADAVSGHIVELLNGVDEPKIQPSSYVDVQKQ